MFKRILFLLFVTIAATTVSAQVTSSSLTGNIRSVSGQPLVGATVKATHIPTGTVYTTQARTDGVFNIVNMIPGGPYKIETSFVGYAADAQSDVVLPLGETIRADADLKPS